MDAVLEFLKAKKTLYWWWVAFCWTAFAAGWAILIILVLVAEFDSKMLSETTTILLGVACFSSLLGGYVFGRVEYLNWKTPHSKPTDRPHNW
ncbi:MAG TPA: hypothetical protein VFH37_01920 [Candidatus Saccharimonadales bacterium]|nr:hypothetical protein [Candidatus Saccharimonadales bacterium]